MEVTALVATGELMHEALGREYYLTGAGLKRDPSFQEIYERHASLAGDAAVDAARSAQSPALLEWVIGVRIGRAVASFEEAQVRWEQQATLSVDGQEVPYLSAPIKLANSADAEYRVALDAARATAGAAALNGMRRDRFQREHDEMRVLGYPDYVNAVATLAGIDLDQLGRDADAFLHASADMYADCLGQLVRRRLDKRVDQLVRADTAWAFRADQYDKAFVPEELLEAATRQMAAMGLDAAQGGRVRFDTAEREGKQPRAFCAPVRVPDEVYLVLRPRGGHSDYRTFWHELGHAMHFASVAGDLPFAARWLGDNSVTEGFAMLWDHLTLRNDWLGQYTDLSPAERGDLVFELAVGELFLVRRYAAKLRYELEFHRSGDLTGLGPAYAELLTSATRFAYLEDDHLLDLDPAFYSARYLRAWQLEAALDRELTERFDAEWFRNPAAGEFVHQLMARGQANAADELAREVTGADLAFDPIQRRLETILS